jgi:glutaredoxin-related protein
LLNSLDGKEKPNDEWPMWGFTQDDVEFKSLEPKTMDILIDKSKRKELAKKNSWRTS